MILPPLIMRRVLVFSINRGNKYIRVRTRIISVTTLYTYMLLL